MTEQEIKDLVTRQRKYFQTGATLPVSARTAALRKLYAAISSNEKEIHNALKKDLGKSAFESYMCETGLVLEEISYMLKHVQRFAGKREFVLRWLSFIPEVIRNRHLTVLYSL